MALVVIGRACHRIVEQTGAGPEAETRGLASLTAPSTRPLQLCDGTRDAETIAAPRWSARDRLVHHYFDINLDILWQTITEDLPQLLAVLPPEDEPDQWTRAEPRMQWGMDWGMNHSTTATPAKSGQDAVRPEGTGDGQGRRCLESPKP
jgi:hypothetical protein